MGGGGGGGWEICDRLKESGQSFPDWKGKNSATRDQRLNSKKSDMRLHLGGKAKHVKRGKNLDKREDTETCSQSVITKRKCKGLSSDRGKSLLSRGESAATKGEELCSQRGTLLGKRKGGREKNGGTRNSGIDRKRGKAASKNLRNPL